MPKQKHIEQLITIHERRLRELEKTEAYQGISIDPKVPLEIDEIKEELNSLCRELEFLKQESNPFSEKGMQGFQMKTQISRISVLFPTGEVEIRIKGDPSNFTYEQKSRLLRMLALSLECPIGEINVLGIRKGSVIVKVEMPEKAVKKLVNLYEDNDEVIKKLEIQDVSLDSGMIGKIEKAIVYSQQPERITFEKFNVTFEGNHAEHTIAYNDGNWTCDCSFFQSRGVCSHIMTLERVLIGSVMPAEAIPIEGSEH